MDAVFSGPNHNRKTDGDFLSISGSVGIIAASISITCSVSFSSPIGPYDEGLALTNALRILAGDVLVAEEIKVATPKTKEFISFLKSQTEAQKVLVISTKFDEVTYKAARNIQPVLLNTAAEVNTEQLLQFQKIIVTNEALAKLAERLA